MYNAHVVGSDHVTFRNVKVISDQNVPNTDGIDPDSSRDVMIDGCFFCCADDCISIKTSGQSGVKGDAERITVRNCVFMSRTSATKFGNETIAGAQRDILFENNDVLEADRAITLSCMDGKPLRKPPLRRHASRAADPGWDASSDSRPCPRPAAQPQGGAGRIHNVLFKNLSVEHDYANPIRLAGFSKEHDVRGIHFVNYTVAGKVRRTVADANVNIGPFVSDVTFAGPSEKP
jgi:hypothetical protein